jgi:hypothetical protein
MRKSWPFALVAIAACSSNPPAPSPSNFDSDSITTDAKAGDSHAQTETPVDSARETATSDSVANDAQIDGDASTESGSESAVDTSDVAVIVSHWQCPKGQSFGSGQLLNWSFAITGTERVSASGASVVWRASPGAPLSVADNTGSGSYAAVSDITATNTCGAFSISPNGLQVVCVTPDGGDLEIAQRTAIGTDFGTPSSTGFSSIMSALSAQLTADGGTFVIVQPVFASGDSTLFFQVQGFGIYQTAPSPPDGAWSAPTFLYDPSPLTLDGAFNNGTLFFWDSNALTTSIAWQWADGSWTLDPLGSEQHVTPNIDCTGAYFFSNALVESPW